VQSLLHRKPLHARSAFDFCRFLACKIPLCLLQGFVFFEGITFNGMALNVDMHGRQMQAEVSLQAVKTRFAMKAGGLI